MIRSTFAGFTTAQLAMSASQRALDVTGQNIANINTRGYSKQRLEISSLNNSGAHGLSEVLYSYASAGGNNGSAFAGFNANTVFLNISLGLVMLFARFLPIIGTLAIAGSLAGKKKIATTAGTLSTTNAMFIFLLIFIVLLVGALSFFPALALGPIAEFFQSIV